MRLLASSMSAPCAAGGCSRAANARAANARAGIGRAGPGRTGRDVQLSPRVVEEVGGEDGQAQVGECLGKLLVAPAAAGGPGPGTSARSEEHTSELQSQS